MECEQMATPAKLTILNTRPSPMGEELQQRLIPQYSSYHFPTISNAPITLSSDVPLKQWLLDKSLAWIFVSRPTAVYFRQLLLQHDLTEFSPAGGIFAIGESTKAELQRFVCNPEIKIITPKHSNSESFLTLKELDAFQRFVQVKGKGGREVIGNALIQQGKQYYPLELYQRQLISYSHSEVCTWQQCDLVLATSIDIAKGILTNLSEQMSNDEIQLLLHKINWVVLSERIKQFLMDNMVKEQHIFICEQSDNSSIINTINLISK
jgi:uroporphyrinogen-III synthase